MMVLMFRIIAILFIKHRRVKVKKEQWKHKQLSFLSSSSSSSSFIYSFYFFAAGSYNCFVCKQNQ